jgi:hypothetical protein
MSEYYSPIKWSNKNREILEKIDRLVFASPQTKKVSLTHTQFKLLFDTIPQHVKNDYSQTIPYKGILITKL